MKEKQEIPRRTTKPVKPAITMTPAKPIQLHGGFDSESKSAVLLLPQELEVAP